MFVERMTRLSALGMCLIFLAMSTVAWTSPAGAQTIDAQALKALRDVQAGQPSSPTTTTSPVDAARSRNSIQKNGQLSQQQQQGALGQMPGQPEEPSALETDYRSRMFDAGQERRKREEEKARQQRLEDIRQLGPNATPDVLPPQASDQDKDPRLQLKQFGYDIFSQPVTQTDMTTGRAPGGYILGVGDQVVVSFHGSTENDYVTNVDSQGRLVIPNLDPIDAAGRRFDDVEAEIRSDTQKSLLGTSVYVSLGQLRSISVYVLGEVKDPGLHQLTSMGSLLDALSLAGGVKKTGTLRQIRVVRGDKVHTVDLYKVLLATGGANLDIRDGDQIVVPPIGRTYAVTGQVTRVGIFELPPGETGLSVTKALAQAGGTLRPRGYAYMANHVADDGRQVIKSMARAKGQLQAGDILNVSLVQDVRVGSVRVIGHVNVPGYVSLDKAPKLSDLINNVDLLKTDPYLPFAVVETTDPATQARVLKAVNLEAALQGKADYTFKSSDWLYVFGMDDMKFLSSPLVQQVIVLGKLPNLAPQSQTDQANLQQNQGQSGQQGQQAQLIQQSQKLRSELGQRAASDTLGSCRGLNRLARIISGTKSDRFTNALANVTADATDTLDTNTKCPDIYDINEELLSFTLEHVVAVQGAVRRPGVYPVTAGARLSSIIQVAGGVMESADLTSVEYLEYKVEGKEGHSQIDRHSINLNAQDAAGIVVTPGSFLRFNQVLNQQQAGGILLKGEFVRPGFYALRRGEKLSQVIARAGGITKQAYPYGAIFTRESAKQAQHEGFLRAARELNSALTLAAVKNNADAQGLAAIQATALQLESVEAAGRVVVEADPTVLTARPSLDISLEPGDELYMPERPSSVTVVGDVLNPGTLQFVPGKSVTAYLREAGGFQRSADKHRVFIVYPNGAAEP